MTLAYLHTLFVREVPAHLHTHHVCTLYKMTNSREIIFNLKEISTQFNGF